jgi:[ribosomal protein S18]-alanine N-acetyltransferase
MTTTAVGLLPMRWWHIPPAMAIERELFGSEAWTEAMFWSELAERDTRYYLVAEVDEEVLGYAGLCAYTADETYVQTIAVAANAQRRGLGTALLQALLDEANRRGAHRVDLEVRADNDAAQRIYVAHGFAPIGIRPRYYQPSGVDAVVMRFEVAR